MLELRNIHKTFNPGTVNAKKALDGLNLTLHDGDFVTVIGGNGAGKSTMLNAISGTFAVDEGQILLDGKDITRLPEHKRAQYLGRVFQDIMLADTSPPKREASEGNAWSPGFVLQKGREVVSV